MRRFTSFTASTILSLGALLWLGACASTAEVKQREFDTQELTNLRAHLIPGMAKTEVTKISTKLGNCTGSERGAERCEAQYLTSVARSIGELQSLAGTAPKKEQSNSHYTKVTFDFMQSKLVKFSETEEVRPSTW